jgi:hypothetical protein
MRRVSGVYGCHLILRRECLPVPKSQKIINLALSPAMILRRERIDAGIDADVTDKEFRAFDEVSYLINSSTAETTYVSRHRSGPLLPSSNICSREATRKWPCLTQAVGR